MIQGLSTSVIEVGKCYLRIVSVKSCMISKHDTTFLGEYGISVFKFFIVLIPSDV